ncbi:MAG: hypothetical protein DRN15_06135 [Thermoprotei archaeon]|nr:MAG: hypothetical protein DRN15_06135 [Thermoprotei archaeon]
MKEAKFIVDAMLGSLARWLRILGVDTLYPRDYSDEELIMLARREKRVIITRDKKLAEIARRQGIEVFLLDTCNIKQALLRVCRRYEIPLSIEPNRTRCPLCNEKLVVVKKPEELLTTWAPPVQADEYWVCPRCRHVYWRGKHFRTMLKVLDELKRFSKA